MTLNNSWGYHAGDHDWKTPGLVVDLLATAAQGRGNLLLNIGPRGDGSVPEASVQVLESVGDWLTRCGGEAIYNTDQFTFDLQERGVHRGDWNHLGPCTARGHTLYWLMRRWPGRSVALGGLEMTVKSAMLLGVNRAVDFRQEGSRLVLSDLPDAPPDSLCPVLRMECDRAPRLYQTGGMRVPDVPHPHYDPCPSDIQH